MNSFDKYEKNEETIICFVKKNKENEACFTISNVKWYLDNGCLNICLEIDSKERIIDFGTIDKYLNSRIDDVLLVEGLKNNFLSIN